MLSDLPRVDDEEVNTHRSIEQFQRVCLIPSSMPLGHRGATNPRDWFGFGDRWTYHRMITQQSFRKFWSLLSCLAHFRGAKLENLVHEDLEGRAMM